MKPTLLIPMAGEGRRFLSKGYTMPKQLIMVDNRHIIDYSFDAIEWEEYHKIIFIVRQEHIDNFAIDEILKQKFGKNVIIISTDTVTQGSVCSCLLAKNYINNDSELVIYCLDVSFRPKFSVRNVPNGLDGLIPTFKANSVLYSYVQIDKKGFATRTAEKRVISENAAVGVYYFKSGKDFVQYAEKMIEAKDTTNEEYYISPLYNHLIQDGKKIGIQPIDKMYVLGTPEEMDFFVRNVSPELSRHRKPIALCADHSGFELKEIVKNILIRLGEEYIDFGTYTDKDCDYNDYISQVASHMKRGLCDFAFGFCRTGQGVNIAANKFRHIRSALVFDEYTASYCIKHNCCNFFSLPSKYVNKESAEKIVFNILNETFDGGRHSSRIQKTEALCDF